MGRISIRTGAFLVLVGCASSYRPQTSMRVVGKSPKGEWQVRITCTQSMEACYDRAAVACKWGYDRLDENGQATGATTQCGPNPFTAAGASISGTTPTQTTCRTTTDFSGVLLVSCKHEGNAVPNIAAH